MSGVHERERIAEWRETCLLEAGYDEDAAWLLANQDHVDLHLAIDLLRAGCDQTLALVILL